MCDNRPSDVQTINIAEDLEYFKMKLYNRYKINPFHNFTAKKQTEIELEFLQKSEELSNDENQSIKNLEFFLKEFDVIDKHIIIETYKNSKKYQITDHKFFMILMFVLSNTKNNMEKKKEFGRFFVKESEDDIGRINLDKLKKIIKHTIRITVNIVINYLALRIFLENVDLLDYIKTNEIKPADKKYKKYELVFIKITKLLRKEFCYKRVINKWENFLLAPYIFASYSSNINLNEYSNELKEEMVKHFVTLFDGKKVIDSLFDAKIYAEDNSTM